MYFTFTNYQQTRNQILEEFSNQKKWQASEQEKEFNPCLYKKILDNLVSHNQQKQRKRTKLKKMESPSIIMSLNNQKILPYFKSIESLRGGDQSNFFITSSKQPHSFSMQDIQELQSQKGQKQPFQTNKTGQTLSFKLFSENSVKQKLRKEIQNLEASLQYLKRQINIMKVDYQNKNLRNSQSQLQKRQSRIFVIKLNQKHRQLKENISRSTRIFDKNLGQRSKSRLFTNRQNMRYLDELTQQTLKMNKMKSTLKQQTIQLDLMLQKQEQLQYHLENYQELVEKYRQIYIINQLFEQKIIGKSVDLKSDKHINQQTQKNNNEKLYFSISEIQQTFTPQLIDNMNPLAIADLISSHLSAMKQQEQDLQKKYLIKLHQKQESKKILEKYTEDTEKNLFQMSQYRSKQILNSLQNEGFQDKYENNRNSQEKCIKGLENQVIKHLANNLIGMQDRLVFCCRRLLNSLKNISVKWLKCDRSATNLIKQLQDQMAAIIKQERNLSESDSKHFLVTSFEKWQKYTFFLEMIHKHPCIYRYLDKNDLCIHLKRIVKTKIKNPNVKTEKIFLAVLHDIENQCFSKIREKVQQTLVFFKKIYKYCSKFQVLIVNSRQDCQINTYKRRDVRVSAQQKQLVFEPCLLKEQIKKFQAHPQNLCNENAKTHKELRRKTQEKALNKPKVNPSKQLKSILNKYQLDIYQQLQEEFNKIKKIT